MSALPFAQATHSAVVVDTDDPYGEMRLKVSVPAVLGDRHVWAWPLVRARDDAPPETGSTVWVVFEGQDLESPLWLAARPWR